MELNLSSYESAKVHAAVGAALGVDHLPLGRDRTQREGWALLSSLDLLTAANVLQVTESLVGLISKYDIPVKVLFREVANLVDDYAETPIILKLLGFSPTFTPGEWSNANSAGQIAVKLVSIPADTAVEAARDSVEFAISAMQINATRDAKNALARQSLRGGTR